MRRPVVLISGAAGEIGHALIQELTEGEAADVVTIDVNPLDEELRAGVRRAFEGSILDRSLLETIQAEYEVDRVFHLAALLSTRSEFTPVTAHQVNVEGTLALLELAMTQARSHGRRVVFFYPSSIAAYGIEPGGEAPQRPLQEDEHTRPVTMYGCNKLYCEHLGRYYARHYKQLDAESHAGRVDFRALRFPGLLSAATVPSGGTSDYGPEMIHAAARGESYACFVRPDTHIPFMAMPDAVQAILDLVAAPAGALSRDVYNVAAFDAGAAELRDLVIESFPDADIGFEPDARRQAIVDSWPAAVDDSAARRDWSFSPRYDLRRAFSDYLVPAVRERYG